LSARFDFAVAAEEFVALVVGEAGPGLLASGVDQASNPPAAQVSTTLAS
jgi:hypothetical protein